MRRHHGSRHGKADWVYRGNKYNISEDASEVESPESGTYYAPINLAVGSDGATAQVLYDSSDYIGGRYGIARSVSSGADIAFGVGAGARPDSHVKGPLIHGCEIGVYVHVGPSAWTGTVFYYLALRVIVARQDPITGQAILDPGYAMWQDYTGAGLTTQPSEYANGRENCWERRIFKSRRTTDVEVDDFYHHSFVRARRRLASHEGLFLYMELHPAGLGLSGSNFINLWCRTLVTDHDRT